MVLAIHIIGAIVTAILAVVSIVALRKNSKHLNGFRAAILASGLFQIISGTILVVMTPEISVARICIASIVYLGAVFGVELALRRGITRQVLAK